MSTPGETPMTRVAMVVFAEVPAADLIDAAALAQIALRQALAGTEQAPPRLPQTIRASLRGDQVPVTVRHVAELAQAALNGYLDLSPSNRAYPEQEEQTR